MGRSLFSHGLHDVGNGCWAFLQPDGGWGWSNAGLLEDSGETLLIDTLFDLPLTEAMLAKMRDAVPAAKQIGTLVNTHANGDHTYGNQIVKAANIVASEATRREMERRPPEAFIKITENWQNYGEFGRLINELMGRKFDFRGIKNTLPTSTFNTSMSLRIGNKTVELLNVGPAHTSGDTLVWIAGDRIVYTGDIIFSGGHPIIWSGPISNWISACDQILNWDVEVVVPGHGPVGDKKCVQNLKQYLLELWAAAKPRFDSGMSWTDAASEIVADHFPHWIDRERVFINVASLWREFSDGEIRQTVKEIYLAMGAWYWAEKNRHDHLGCTH